MKYLAALFVSIFLILLSVFCVIRLYVRPNPNTILFETIRTNIDTMFWYAWTHENPFAHGLYSTVFKNRDKSAFFPPRVMTKFDDKGKPLKYTTYGMVKSWDSQQKLFTMSSYTGGMLYVRFDPDTYKQKATLLGFGTQGTIDTSKPMKIITTFAIPNVSTLFCEGDVFAIETATWQEVFSTTPDRPLIPKELVLSHRLCQNTP